MKKASLEASVCAEDCATVWFARLEKATLDIQQAQRELKRLGVNVSFDKELPIAGESRSK